MVDEKNVLNDFLIWVYEQQKFAFATEVEGELGREWVPVMAPFPKVIEDYQQFVAAQGRAVEVFGQQGWHHLD